MNPFLSLVVYLFCDGGMSETPPQRFAGKGPPAFFPSRSSGNRPPQRNIWEKEKSLHFVHVWDESRLCLVVPPKFNGLGHRKACAGGVLFALHWRGKGTAAVSGPALPLSSAPLFVAGLPACDPVLWPKGMGRTHAVSTRICSFWRWITALCGRRGDGRFHASPGRPGPDPGSAFLRWPNWWRLGRCARRRGGGYK